MTIHIYLIKLHVLPKPSSVSDGKNETDKKEAALGSLTPEVSYSHLKKAMLYKAAPGGPLQISYFINHIVNHKDSEWLKLTWNCDEE